MLTEKNEYGKHVVHDSGLLHLLCNLAQPENMWIKPPNWHLIRPLLCGMYVSPLANGIVLISAQFSSLLKII